MKSIPLMVAVLLCTASATAKQDETKEAVVESMVQAASAFMEMLDEAQQEAVTFPFTDVEQRYNWSNLPEGIVSRGGLRWGDLNGKQQAALKSLLKASLSADGYQQLIDNMDGDEVLRQRGRPNNRVRFGRDEYFVSFLGQPSTTDPWMLQFGGHHLAINITVVGGQMTISPSLTGGQPVEYSLDGRTVRQLESETNRSFRFIGSLTPDQLERAVLGNRYTDLRFGPGKEDAKPQQEGLPASALTAEQRVLLLDLIRERIGLLKAPFANSRMEQIKRQLDQTWVSWYGETSPGGTATFRIQGPTILMEYAPQRLGGKPTDHLHAMYRHPTNDYGVGFLQSKKQSAK